MFQRIVLQRLGEKGCDWNLILLVSIAPASYMVQGKSLGLPAHSALARKLYIECIILLIVYLEFSR